MLAAETVTLSLSAIQWIVGLSLVAFGGASGVLVARALHGQALSQLQEWKKALVDAGLTAARWKEFLEWKKSLTDAGLTIERWREWLEWKAEAEEQLEGIAKKDYARLEVEKALEKQAIASGSSTTHGTRPYPQGRG